MSPALPEMESRRLGDLGPRLMRIALAAGVGGLGTPAQLKSTSISAGSCAIAASTEALSIMFVWIACLTGAFTSPMSRAWTSAPSASSSSVAAAPMPDAAPVITHTLPATAPRRLRSRNRSGSMFRSQ